MLAPRHNFRKRQQLLNGFRVALRTFYLLGWAETGRSFRHHLVRVADRLFFLGQMTKISLPVDFFRENWCFPVRWCYSLSGRATHDRQPNCSRCCVHLQVHMDQELNV